MKKKKNKDSKLTHIGAQQEEICAKHKALENMQGWVTLRTKEGMNNTLKMALLNLKSYGFLLGFFFFFFKVRGYNLIFFKLQKKP